MENYWDINKIQEILPQKYPFLFVDSVLELDPKAKKAVCLKNVTINDYFFEGHFPGNPIMPGVLIIEAMAQASILLYAALKPKVASKRPDFYLGKVEARFKKPVTAGDQLIIEVYGEKLMDKGGVVKAVAKVNEQVVTEAEILFGIKPRDE
ncbi:MAG: 3-hydroxyacyl-ACP dehydratase FabZ [Candidatus Omnitrophota bacterium]